MKTYTKHEVFNLIQPLIDKNTLIAGTPLNIDFALGILDANKRLIKLQRQILDI